MDWDTATSTYPAHNSYLSYVKWTSPVTSRLLVETGFSAVQFPTEFGTPLPGIVKDVGTPEWYAGALKQDIALNTFVGQSNFSSQFAEQPSYSVSSAVSYVTGSHNAKAGVYYRYANSDSSAPGANAHLTQQYQNRAACQSAGLRGPPPSEHQHRRVLRLRDGFVGPQPSHGEPAACAWTASAAR